MQKFDNEYTKLIEILNILKTEGYIKGSDWEAFGRQIKENFNHYSPYQRQTLLNSLTLIMNSRDQLNSTREFIHRFNKTIDFS